MGLRLGFFFLCLAVHFGMAAQSYKHSSGIRLGATSGLTYKSFIIEEEAIELMMSGRKEGLQLTTMYTFHKPLELAFNENFFLYYGVGAHLGYERYKNLSKTLTSIDPPSFVFEPRRFFVMGADVLLGVEYRWLSVPMTMSFDIKPYFTYIGMRYTDGKFWDAALSFKYIF